MTEFTKSFNQSFTNVLVIAKYDRVLQRVLPEFYQCAGHSKHPLSNTQDKSRCRHHQMVNSKIRWIIFFVAKDGKALQCKNKTRS